MAHAAVPACPFGAGWAHRVGAVREVRTLISVVQVGAKLLETGELEERITRLERAVASQERRG
ncbi:MAG: hypothetical protein Kow0010_10750 [Dehalococcoidia bacterium]